MTRGALVVVWMCCSVAVAAETTDGTHFTQAPEVAPVKGQPKVAPADKPVDAPLPERTKWIWGADQDTKYALRTKFTGNFESATLRAAADNQATIYLNGKRVGSVDSWETPAEFNVTKSLVAGENTLVAEVANSGGPAGFLLRLTLKGTDGKVTQIVTDETWQAADGRESTNWVAARSVAKYGDAPWQNVFHKSGPAPEVAEFQVLPGFQVERLFTVPKEELGSWVCITLDDKGRIIASDERDKGLCRITPSPLGSNEPTKVERLSVKIGPAQGLLHAFGALYVTVNGGPSNGLFRLRDTDGDDQYDEVVQLKAINGGGEHGPHALRLSPDGKSLILICGNHTHIPDERKTNAPVQTMAGVRSEPIYGTLPEGETSRIVPNWDEDLFTPRQWDAGGHAVGVMAPGGWIAKTDPDGKTWEILSIGYRNQYDGAYNADGELFAYDADMEWDIGAPWYRPTRVVHATSGSEFGWRSGSGKWPAYFADSLPEAVNIGPGSPVGVEFGYGTKFPAKYQRGLYLCDWTFGTIHVVHLEPQGSTYRGVKEEFLSRNGLPLTDIVVGKDGAIYFSVGGRGTQSELYRVTYAGTESTAPVSATNRDGADQRALRHQLEAYHRVGADAAKGIPFLVQHLGHSDRFLRYAARVGLEFFPADSWADRILQSRDVNTIIHGTIGLARVGGKDLGPKLIAKLQSLDFGSLPENQQIDLLRAYQLTLLRLGLPDAAPTPAPNTAPNSVPAAGPKTQALGSFFAKLFPQKSEPLNRELAVLMIGLEAPEAASKLVPVLTRERVNFAPDWSELISRNPSYGPSIRAMLDNQPDQLQVHLAFHLRNLRTGWTPEQRQTYFAWFDKARGWNGGVSYSKYLTNIDNEAFDRLSDGDKVLVEGSGARKPYKAPTLPTPVGPGKPYTLDELTALSSTRFKGRNFDNGKKMFAAARCVICHRFAGEGGATGPDLTQAAGRFNYKDLCESIVDPSKIVSDQYRTTEVSTKAGKNYVGRVLNVTPTAITMLIDPEDSTKLVTVQKDEIEEQRLSPVSLMPKDLLKTLNEDEVLDLLAYLLSRGDKQHALFQK